MSKHVEIFFEGKEYIDNKAGLRVRAVTSLSQKA